MPSLLAFACAALRLTDTSLPAQSLRLLTWPGSSLLQWGAGLLACAQRAAGLQLSCCAPGSSPAQLTAVQVGRASARPTTNPAQGAPPPYPCRPAPHAPRRARAHPPCPSHRTIGRFAPLSHNSHTRVPTFVQGSTRAFERGAVRLLGSVFCLKMRCRGQNFLPGLRPGPRGRTGPLAGYGVCWGVPQRRCMAPRPSPT